MRDWRVASIFTIVCVLIVSVVHARDPRAGSPRAPSIAAPVVTQAPTPAVPAPVPTQPPNGAIVAAANELLVGEAGVYGVVMVDQEGSVLYGRNLDAPFLPGSMYKLLLVAEIYRLRETGELSFDEALPIDPAYFDVEIPGEPMDGYYPLETRATTVEDAVFGLIVFSSNVASIALLERVGREAVNTMAPRLGMTSTHLWVDPERLPDWPPSPKVGGADDGTAAAVEFVDAAAEKGVVSITTPRDIATFFTRLLDEQVVGPAASAEILDLLKQQTIRDRIPALLPEEVEVANKTGTLDNVINDAGVIYAPSGPVIVAALTEAVPDETHAAEVIQRLGLLAYERANA